jgi:hypothetical protein
MHIDPYIVLGSAVVGLLVGMTGAGGGALMTPMLILLFGVQPAAAISSDLVAAVVMRPVGAAVHLRKGIVNLRLVGWMVLGSVPMAFAGAYLLHLLGSGAQRARRPGGLTAVLAGAGPLHPPGHHVRDLRIGPEYVGVPVTALGWILGLILLAAVVWLAWVRPWRHRAGVRPTAVTPTGTGPGQPDLSGAAPVPDNQPG